MTECVALKANARPFRAGCTSAAYAGALLFFIDVAPRYQSCFSDAKSGLDVS